MSNGEKGKIQCKINENDLIYSLYLPLRLKGENESPAARAHLHLFSSRAAPQRHRDRRINNQSAGAYISQRPKTPLEADFELITIRKLIF